MATITYEKPEWFELLVDEHERNMEAMAQQPSGNVAFVIEVGVGYDRGPQDPYISTSVNGKAREDMSLVNAGEYTVTELLKDHVGHSIRVLSFRER